MKAIIPLFCLALGLIVAMVFVSMIWTLQGRPSRSRLITVGAMLLPLYNMVGGLVFIAFAVGFVEQSLVRGTHWYQFRTAFSGHFFVEVGMFAALGLRAIQTNIRELRQKNKLED